MDVLTDWLREIGTGAVVLARSRAPAPWGMRIAARDGLMFHIVTEGRGWLRFEGSPPVALTPGDLALLPHGLDHDVVDHPDSAAIPLDEFLAQPSRPLTGEVSTVVCGVYRSDAQLAHPMLHALPPVLHFPAARMLGFPELSTTLKLLIKELESEEPGREALLQYLFDALFVYVARAWGDATRQEGFGCLGALKDPYLSKALMRIHREPAAPWTVATLAREAGLSRAAFARRFTELVNEPPLSYLTRWRMAVAGRLLHSSSASLAEVAEQVGYESEFAFSRAFKKFRGLPPAQFRRTIETRESTEFKAGKPVNLRLPRLRRRTATVHAD